jgi:hypothetical protein
VGTEVFALRQEERWGWLNCGAASRCPPPVPIHRRSCPRGSAAHRRATRARGAQPRPVLHLRCARGGGRAPPRTRLAALRSGVPTFSGLRDLGRGAWKTQKTQAARRSSERDRPHPRQCSSMLQTAHPGQLMAAAAWRKYHEIIPARLLPDFHSSPAGRGVRVLEMQTRL